ncbi:helix-turn-helix domain-containing protein [Prescottella equi]|uniref:helix-turn-helix transcriptional regulator n=1 Tax=Rhodococcus hoagii TaxID=43767 RepID=UPI00300FB3F3
MATATQTEQHEYMTTSEVSSEKRIPAETLRYWRATNTGPASFKIGRRVMYRRTDVADWFAAQEAATRRGGSGRAA